MNKAIKNTFSIALFGLFFIERLGRWRAFEMNTQLNSIILRCHAFIQSSSFDTSMLYENHFVDGNAVQNVIVRTTTLLASPIIIEIAMGYFKLKHLGFQLILYYTTVAFYS